MTARVLAGEAAAAPPAGGPARQGWALAGLATAQFMVILDSSIVNVALPSIRRGLDLGPAGLSWVVDGYLVAFAGLLLLGGRLADVFRRRAVLLGGLALFTAASAVCALAPDGPVLVGGRVVQGAGGAVMAPAALSIVMTLFPDGHARSRALGVWGGVSGAGGIAGVLLGGVLSQTLGWPWIFVINVPVGLAVGAVVLTAVRPSPAAGGGFDLAGAVTVTLAMAALAYGLVSGSGAGWCAPVTLTALTAGVLALAAFVAVERRASRPLVPLTVFTRPRLVIANAIMLMTGAVTVGLFYFLPQYQQTLLGMTPLETSLTQLPIALTITAGGLLAPRVAATAGPRAALAAGPAVLTVGLAWLAPADPHAGLLRLLGPFLLVGAGVGTAFVHITSLAVAGAATEETGLVSGLVNTTRQMGGALGLATLVAVSTRPGRLPDLSVAFLGAGVFAATGLLLSLLPALQQDPDVTAGSGR
ncbi:MFS transporter [Actinoallomurus sp. NBC_01490]|jgi:EmrB/QacA subfamily drug resistance transporter|uniref:MFS transporter n=1 Tax=Actinoallomurus sp. NBC_01490 TaxID=2903557 RepID=UPI002E30596C|nr:MFS transporter [Actinoallomurus sp. NBC_01490]